MVTWIKDYCGNLFHANYTFRSTLFLDLLRNHLCFSLDSTLLVQCSLGESSSLPVSDKLEESATSDECGRAKEPNILDVVEPD